ncbi:MAG: hypothetical protein DRH04_03070, partial [Deltaproteobacteria bacterium]
RLDDLRAKAETTARQQSQWSHRFWDSRQFAAGPEKAEAEVPSAHHDRGLIDWSGHEKKGEKHKKHGTQVKKSNLSSKWWAGNFVGSLHENDLTDNPNEDITLFPDARKEVI